MGIRFLRMAGTSAGAINTAMLTVIGKKQEEKSGRVLDAITNLNFFDLVDGHPVARWMIKRFITHKKYFQRVRNVAIGIIGLFTLLLAGSIVSLILVQKNEGLLNLSRSLLFALVVVMIIIGELVHYILKLIRKFKTAGYGINPHFFITGLKSKCAIMAY